MKLKLIVATAAAVVLPLTTFAQEATPDPAPARLAKTRAEVRAELDHAQRSGAMKVLSAGYIGGVSTPRSRADVVAELLRARANGECAALNAEATDFARPANNDAPNRLASGSRS